MASAKDIQIKPISATTANALVKRLHYSGKVVPNSQLHLGVFLDGVLEGAMQFGPSLRKHFTIQLVRDTPWNGFIELNRMAFSNALPRNSESRAIAIALRMLKKNYPHLKWVISFADATQCGDGTIYRASGFLLTGIKANSGIRINPATGKPLTRIAAYHQCKSKEFETWQALEGFQLRYVYFLDKSFEANLTSPVLPYSKITELRAGMYKGRKKD